MFDPVRGKPDFPAIEAVISQLWRERGVYKKSLEQRRDAKRFVFFEGPPTANGMPHPGHCLTRTIKDLYPRYRTMRGEYCERKAGWDTHGLPVEVEVCKELGIHSKAEIEAFGVEPFIHRCQESVWRYMKEWETLTERIGFWIDLSDAYVTYHQSYVESVWWALAELFNRGLLYQGHKIVWWWAQGGTALSSGEVGQGYREVADPSVYVAFPLLDDAGNPTTRSLVAWTTTPWTLPANQFAAVKADLDYVVLQEAQSGSNGTASDIPAQEFIVAEPLATDETPSHPEHAPSRVLRAVFVGRLSPMKNLDLVLEALALCTSSIEFDIYGPTESPEYWERCQSLLRALPTNIRARYRGVLLPNEVVEALTSYEIYIFPTKGENFGHSIAESLAAGCKVLCSDQTPWSELLEAGAGWVITDPNPRRLAECVDRFGGLTEDARYLERLRARELFESWRSAQPHTNVLAASLRLESSHD